MFKRNEFTHSEVQITYKKANNHLPTHKDKNSGFHVHKLTHNTQEDKVCGIMRNRFDMLKGQNKAISSIAVCVEHPQREPESRATHRHTHLLRSSHTAQKETRMLECFKKIHRRNR